MDSFDLIIFLITVNIGFIFLVIILFCYIITGKIISNYRDARKKKLFGELEDAFLPLIVSNDESGVQKVLANIGQKNLENFIEFISVYLSNIKGDDFDRIINAVYKSPAFKILCDSTTSGDLDTRLYSIYCLGLLKKPVCIDNLLNALSDANFFVRMAAVKAIAEIGCFSALDQVLDALSREKLVTSYKLSETLWSFGEEICEPLLKILKTRDGRIIKIHEEDLLTASVIEILGYFKYFDASEEIHAVLKETKINLIIKNCIYSLGKMVYTDSLRDVEKYLDSRDPEVRVSAVKAILEFRSVEKIDTLKYLLNDSDWNVRYNAAVALYEMSFDFQGYMFSPELAGQEMSRAYRTIVHVLTEKYTPEAEAGI